MLMMYTHFVYSVYMRLAQQCEQVFEHFNWISVKTAAHLLFKSQQPIDKLHLIHLAGLFWWLTT